MIDIHRANQDIQYITDEYSVAEYISGYCTKTDGGTTSLLKKINEESMAMGEASKDTLRKLAKALDKGREVGIQESIYRTLGLSMTRFSCIVKFINTCHPDRREGLLKANLEHLTDNESIFHNSLHDYYQDRPFTGYDEEDDADFDNMSLAEFVSQYDIVYNSQRRKNSVKLLNGRGIITKRRTPCVIRYFLRYENKEEFYRALCILFLPFRNEYQEIHVQDVETLYFQNEAKIEPIRRHFEKNRKLVDIIKNITEENVNMDDNESSDDDDDYFIDNETTDSVDIQEFEKNMKMKAKKLVGDYNDGVEKITSEQYLQMMISLNDQQQKIFYDFCERMINYDERFPFYIYIAGEAGTGKSFLMKLMIEFVRRLPRPSGKELDKPMSITIAPTGVAAYLINGSTIHSALGMQRETKKNYVGCNESQNSNLRFMYEDLKVIFLDETSMVGSSMLAKINYRLQDILGKRNQFMGGVSIITTGDFGQLPPVGEPMIWERTHIDGRLDMAPNHWDENFTIFYLTQKMRSQDDQFSNICDKIRRGICDSEVKKYMEDHVKKCPNENNLHLYQRGKLSIIVTNNEDRKMINQKKLDLLLPDKKAFIVSASDDANIKNPPPLSEKLPLTLTGQLEKQIVFKEGAPVMITTNHPTKKYKSNGIVNGVRGFIDSIQTAKNSTEDAEIIWVRFPNENTGRKLREDNQHLLQEHKPNDPFAVPFKRTVRSFTQKGNVNWRRDQFPLTLAFAITCHKVNIFSNQFLCISNSFMSFRAKDRLWIVSLLILVQIEKLKMDPFILHFQE